MSIGTLLAYTIVSASVIVLRYAPDTDPAMSVKDGDDASVATSSSRSDSLFDSQAGRLRQEFWWLSGIVGGCGRGGVASGSVFTYICCSAALCVHIHFSATEIAEGEWWAIACAVFLIATLLGCLFVISAHRQNSSGGTFRVPWVPLIPGLSILCNIGLMVHLNVLTWVRFVVWMSLGLLVYFLYGIRHSKEGDLTNPSSMLMTSSEAFKEPWGAIGPRDEDCGGQSAGSATDRRKPRKSKKESNEEKTILVDEADGDDS